MTDRRIAAAARRALALLLGLAGLAAVPIAFAEDAAAWLARAAAAARQQSYVGAVVYQRPGYIEASRLTHLNDLGEEFEKLVSLEGPAREVIRGQGEVRCYYPDIRLVRIEPRTFRNAFPSLSPQQQKTLGEFYDFRKAEVGRVAGLEAQAWVFVPRDGFRYGYKFWADPATGLLVKARTLDERGEVIEQSAFTEVSIGAAITREMVKPTWPLAPPDWRIRQPGQGDVDLKDTGWVVTRVPAGFAKIVEGIRRLRGTRDVAHLVYSDGMVAVSVFIEPLGGAAHPIGSYAQGGVNVHVRQLDDNLVTVLGEAPVAAVRQIADSVARR